MVGSPKAPKHIGRGDRIIAHGKVMIVDFVDVEEDTVVAIDLFDGLHRIDPADISYIASGQVFRPKNATTSFT